MTAADAEAQRLVVVTGAAGRIGRAIAPALAHRWDLRLADTRSGDGIRHCDITDLHACRTVFQDADAVVHLAAVPDPAARWDELLPANIVGAYTVAQAAIDCGVRRLVLASSLHAVSGLPADVQVRAEDQARPGNLYGATKVWSEALGSWVAATSATTVVALRIGYFRSDRPTATSVSPSERSAWLSPRDASDLVRAAVEADGVTFAVANGVSANRYPKADVGEAVRSLGYQPVDDAWDQERDLT